MTTAACPSTEILSAWLDDELQDAAAREVDAHLDRCDACRDQVIEWMELTEEMTVAARQCLDGERLVAWVEGTLRGDEAARADEHVRGCPRCAREVRGIKQLEGVTASRRPGGWVGAVLSRRGTASVPGASAARRSRASSGGRLAWLRRPGPAISAAAVAALVIVALVRTLPRGDRQLPSRTEPSGPAVGDHIPALMERAAEEAKSKEQDRATLPEMFRQERPAAPDLSAHLGEHRALVPAAPAQSEGALARGKQPAAPAPSGEAMGVARPTLSGRAGPDETQPVVAEFSADEVTELLAMTGEWTQVELRDRRRLWVRSQQLAELGVRARGLGLGGVHSLH